MAGNGDDSENESGITDEAAPLLQYLQDPLVNRGLQLLQQLLQEFLQLFPEIHQLTITNVVNASIRIHENSLDLEAARKEIRIQQATISQLKQNLQTKQQLLDILTIVAGQQQHQGPAGVGGQQHQVQGHDSQVQAARNEEVNALLGALLELVFQLDWDFALDSEAIRDGVFTYMADALGAYDNSLVQVQHQQVLIEELMHQSHVMEIIMQQIGGGGGAAH